MKTISKETKIVFKFNADQILEIIKHFISDKIKEFNVYSDEVIVNIEKISEEALEVTVYHSIDIEEE